MKKPNILQGIDVLVLSILSFLLLGAITLPDPTRPPNFILSPKSVSQTTQQLTLSAIFIYPNYRFAIINGTVLKTGDRLGEFTITSIDSYTVELLGPDNEKQVLQLILPVKEAR